MPSSQTPFAAIFRCLSGIKQCIVLAGLLTLALTVVAWKGLAGRKQLLVPAGLISLALMVLLLVRLARYRLRAALAGSLLLALVAVSAGTTLGVDDPYLRASPGDGSAGEYNDQGHLLLEIRPGITVTYTIDFVGDPLDHPNVNCGDYLYVHIFSGGWLDYLEIGPYNFGYDTDPNNDGTCDDGGWDDFHGNTETLTVATDAIGNVSTRDTLNKLIGVCHSTMSPRRERMYWGERYYEPANICGSGIRRQEAQDPPGDIPGAHG